MQGQSSGSDRYRGAKEIFDSYDYMTIVYDVNCDWQDEKAVEAIEAALLLDISFDVIMTAWDGAALGAYDVLSENKALEGKIIAGFDAYPRVLNLIDDEEIDVDIAQNPYDMGYQSVLNLYYAINGDSVEPYIDTGVTLISKDNVSDYIKP